MGAAEKVTQLQKLWGSIAAALDKGYRVEILKDKDGNVKAQTIQRKVLLVEKRDRHQ